MVRHNFPKGAAPCYNSRMNDTIREKLKLLPDAPGVYRMYNAAGEIIYVGKAVNLKNRVRSYFRAEKDRSPKVAAMVAKIEDFDVMLCSTNLEALILECNLIHQIILLCLELPLLNLLF